MTPEQFEQEFECNFDAAVVGAYYGKEVVDAERAGRVAKVEIDAALPVQTAWDLGIGDSTAIWAFQITHGGIRVVDYYENHSQPLAHYVGVLESKGYKGRCWVPHDAKARELGTGRTRVETLLSLGRDVALVPNHTVMDGINAARVSFKRFHFDELNCRQGLEALRQYRSEFDEKAKVFKDRLPLHGNGLEVAAARREAEEPHSRTAQAPHHGRRARHHRRRQRRMSNQSALQAAIRASTGTTHDMNGDWLALFASAGMSTGSFNERMLAWLNGELSASYTSLPAAQQAYAVAQGAARWSDLTTIAAGTPDGALVLGGDYLQLDGAYLVLN
jgi:hypothetical protein